MPTRKRSMAEVTQPDNQDEPNMLVKLQNTWEFANIMQYISIFGKAVKIDENLTIEDLEQECCKPEASTVLSEIGLALLKNVSSHRGLTPEIFDEYTRRQYVAKAPTKNPFGTDDEPRKFSDFDVFLKLKVLVQLSLWTLNNSERIRDKMEERSELQQAMQWRISEIGYDRDDRNYYALDDNRLYRRTAPPPPPTLVPKAKARTKPKSKKTRTSGPPAKRRKTRQTVDTEDDAEEELTNSIEEAEADATQEIDDGLGGLKWECVAITLAEYQDFLKSISKSRDPNEKVLFQCITNDILPIIEAAESSQLRKQQKRERELLNMQKLATAKRSSRIEAKIERERVERDAQEAERKKMAELAEAEAYQRKQHKLDMDRESRMMTREQRIKEREMKRILHEQELARMAEEEKKVDAGESRLSERHLKLEIEKRKKELASLTEEDEWTFDCSKCGKHGANWDDGTHSVACERCNIWQHSACLGISQEAAEKDDFHFVCQDCRRREEDAKKPKIPTLKFRLNTTSPPDQKPAVVIPAQRSSEKHKLDDTGLQSPQKKQKSSDFRELQLQADGRHPNSGLPNGSVLPAFNGSPAFNQPNIPNLHRAVEQPPASYFQPPPFLSSHQRPQTQQPSTFSHQSHTNGHLSSPPGVQYGQYPPAHLGWSARYVPPSNHVPTLDDKFSPHIHENHAPSGATQTHAKPSSYHAELGQGPKISPLIPQHTSPAPSQLRTPGSSFESRATLSSTSPQVNGFPIHGNTENLPTGPPSQSPVKRASPPAARSPESKVPHSVPTPAPPSFPTQGASPGFSPVKHASPPHRLSPPNHNASSSTSTVPSIAQLVSSPPQQFPVPQQHIVSPPMKNHASSESVNQ